MRLFVAVNFDARVRDLIAGAIDAFPVDLPPWRWSKPDTWHLTLKFLGEIPDTDVALISRCLEGVAARHRTFELAVGEFGGFPSLRRPRVLMFKVGKGAGELEALAAEIDQTLLDVAGIPKESKRFRAHATIARVKNRLDPSVTDRLASVSPLVGAIQTVGSIDLMKSELRPQGARYECLKAFALPLAP